MKPNQSCAKPSRGERSRYGSWLVLLAAVACGPAPVASIARRREATADYTSTVRPNNQAALGASAVPFARYLNAMHSRIHPLFSDAYLGSLDALAADHPLNDLKLVARLEIVLTREGRIEKMGIVRTSGVSAFDLGSLESVQHASPFGAAPDATLSPDGRVYLHWEFHRAATLGCSTMNARPYLLHTRPKPDEPLPAATAP